MIKILLCLLNGILSRLDGCSSTDNFLPFIPIKINGINYARALMGIPIFLMSGNPWHMASYFLVALVFWVGENHWLTKLVGKHWCWFITGLMYGLASFIPLYGLWYGCVFFTMVWLSQKDYLDWSIFELLHGILLSAIFIWR